MAIYNGVEKKLFSLKGEVLHLDNKNSRSRNVVLYKIVLIKQLCGKHVCKTCLLTKTPENEVHITSREKFAVHSLNR